MSQRSKTKPNTNMRITSRGVFRMASNSLLEPILYWTLMSGLILPEVVATARVVYKNDHCVTKSQYGLCKEWSECPTIKRLIERNEYSVHEVVRCGFNTREEIICCPVVKTNERKEGTTAHTADTPTTTQLYDIRLNVLDDLNSTSTTTTTTTTQKPYFWQDLLSRSTMNPPIIGKKRLNKSLLITKSAKSMPQRFENGRITGKIYDNIEQYNVDSTDGQQIFGPANNKGILNGHNERSPSNEIAIIPNFDQLNIDLTDGQTIFGPTNSEKNGFIQVPPPKTNATERPAIKACKRITKGLHPTFGPHILDGTPANLGEFPHMVAIGYSHRNAPNGPYYTLCGGSLVDTRFVVTAAHCLDVDNYIPRTVIMGVVDLSDPDAWQDAVVIRIKKQTMHEDYSPSRTYNDIAVLELEEAIPDHKFIYPVCLHTDEADPREDNELWVTGWGTVNTLTTDRSSQLLKASLQVTALDRCNATFNDYGLHRQIGEGIVETLLCAAGKDNIRDACTGDSGGPLNLVVDEAYGNYRLVGVIVSGISCGNSTPGLYTRVASFLDFIERIVWPNGGD